MYIWCTSKSTYYFQPWKILSFFHLSMACVWHSEESKFCRHKAQDAYSHYFVAYSHFFLGIKKLLIRTIFSCLIALFFIPNRTIFSAIKQTKFSLFAQKEALIWCEKELNLNSLFSFRNEERKLGEKIVWKKEWLRNKIVHSKMVAIYYVILGLLVSEWMIGHGTTIKDNTKDSWKRIFYIY